MNYCFSLNFKVTKMMHFSEAKKNNTTETVSYVFCEQYILLLWKQNEMNKMVLW